jgi:hypothetical protein
MNVQWTSNTMTMTGCDLQFWSLTSRTSQLTFEPLFTWNYPVNATNLVCSRSSPISLMLYNDRTLTAPLRAWVDMRPATWPLATNSRREIVNLHLS